MKKIFSLAAFLLLFVAITCENEPIDEGVEAVEPNLSCEQASLNTAEAALNFINGIEDGDYEALCNAYKEALEAQIEACGDPDGAIQQGIDALGNCTDPENFDDCDAAENAANLAQINFENATDDNYTDLCTIYVSTLENQIVECGDDDGSIQSIIDGLGDCNNDVNNEDCNMAIQSSENAQSAFENATDDNYNELCLAYVSALEDQINVCGDDNGNLQETINNLGDCSVPASYEIGDIGPAGGYVFYITNGGQNGLEIAPEETQFQSQWGCPITSVPGTVSDFGSGQANSDLILAYHESINYYNNPDQCTDIVLALGDVAAKNCDDLVFNGYDDWYFPSFDELQMVYDNLHSQGMGDINPSDWFSSSTQDPNDITEFRFLVFTDGTNFGLDKNDLTNHRAIRSF